MLCILSSRTSRSALAAWALLLGSALSPARAQFNVMQSSGLFEPSFRGEAGTTYFGWDTFGPDGALINNPPADLGTNYPGLALTQESGAFDHLSGSGNIYTGEEPLDLAMTIVTDGTDGTGFTTIIVQGHTLFGDFGSEILPGEIAGIAPVEVVQAMNLAGMGQFWAKYEIPGSEPTYLLDLDNEGAFISLDKLAVDVLWSPDGYAADAAIVPEPGALVLAGAAALGLFAMRRFRAA